MVWKQELSQVPSEGLGHRSPDSPERARDTAATGLVWVLAMSQGRCDKAFVQPTVKEPAVIPSAIAVARIDRTSRSELNACLRADGKPNRSVNCPRAFNFVDCGPLARSVRFGSKNRLFRPTLGDVATDGRQGEIPTSTANAHAFASILREALRRVRAVQPQPIVHREAMPVNMLVHAVGRVLGWARPRSWTRDLRRNSNVTRGLR